jgi:predicted DNA-binding transcriptional regulator YafY
MVGFSVEELAALATAANLARRDNLSEVSARLDTLSAKLKSLIRPDAARRIGPDLEVLTEAEGMALRPGPRQSISADLLAELRHAIIACRKVRLHYRARGTGRLSRQPVCPYGFLYGNRQFLVAYSLSDRARDFRLFSLANIDKAEILESSFQRRKDFSLQKFAERSFGVFQEEPFKVVWRFSRKAAPDARQFLLHPTQVLEDQRWVTPGALPRRRCAGNVLASVYLGWGGGGTGAEEAQEHAEHQNAMDSGSLP